MTLTISRVTEEQFSRRFPRLYESYDRRRIQRLIGAYNEVVGANGRDTIDMGFVTTAVLHRANKMKGKRLPDSDGIRGFVSCLVSMSIEADLPQATLWADHLNANLSVLSTNAGWPQIRSGFRKMLHGNSIVAMATEAHVGAACCGIGDGIRMHQRHGGDVSVEIDGVATAIEVKTRVASFEKNGVEVVGDLGMLLRGELDHFLDICEKRAPKCQSELDDYALEVLVQYKEACRDCGLGEGGIARGPSALHVCRDTEYIDYLLIYTKRVPGKGKVFRVHGGLQNPETEAIRSWIDDKIEEACGQLPAPGGKCANVIICAIPAPDGPLFLIRDDLEAFLEHKLKWERVDAVLIGEYFTPEDGGMAVAFLMQSYAAVSQCRPTSSLVEKLRRAVVNAPHLKTGEHT